MDNEKHKYFIKASDFVRRQTPGSRYSHFEGSWEELEELCEASWRLGRTRPGYRHGVVLADVEPDRFMSSVVSLEEGVASGAITKLEAVYEPRREGEKAVVQVRAYGKKQPAKSVYAVLYCWDVLDEGNERSQDSEWEIVSINASPTEEEVPMGVTARARNILVEAGGTDPRLEEKSKEELIEFIRSGAASSMFWSRHAMVQPDLEGARDRLQEELDRLERGAPRHPEQVTCHRCGMPCKLESAYGHFGRNRAFLSAGNSMTCSKCVSKMGKRKE